MIVNINPAASFIVVLRELEETNLFDFHLTGSRFFAPKEPRRSSDIDFFTQDSGNVRDFLRKLGFTLCSRNPYYDSQTLSVHRFGCIDVQLVRDSELKVRVQERIRLQFPRFEEKSVDEQRQIWEMGFQFLALEQP